MATEKAKAQLEYKAIGLDTLSNIGNAITGINQGLELMSKGMRVITGLTKQFIETGSQFEQFNLQFETLLGSMDKAEERMKAITKFAEVTPFDLPGVVEAAKVLEAYRIYSERALRAAGDAASAFGKDFTETALAVASATTGEMERLKMFGITSAKLAEHLGHELVRNTSEGLREIGDAVIELFEIKAGGGMERMSKSLTGIISNLGDKWIAFKKIVADAEVFESVREIFGAILEDVNELFETGKAARLGKVIGETLGDVMWDIAETLAGAVDALETIASVFRGIHGIFTYGAREAAPLPTQFGGEIPTGELSRRERIQAYRRRFRLRGVAPPESMYGLDLGIPEGFAPLPAGAARQWAGEQALGPPRPAALVPRGFRARGIEMSEEQQEELERTYDLKKEFEKEWQDWVKLTEQTALEKRMNLMQVAWEKFYGAMFKMTTKWQKIEDMRLKDFVKAMKGAFVDTLAAFVQMKTQQAAVEKMWEAAKALSAGASMNFWAVTKHLAAAAAYGAIGGIAGGLAANYAAAQAEVPGGAPDLADTPEGGVEDARRDGGRSITRSTGVVRQTLNIVVNNTHLGPTVYGPGGWEELIEEIVIPAVRNAVATGDI